MHEACRSRFSVGYFTAHRTNKAASADGERTIVEMPMATRVGMTRNEFTALVNESITTARHPHIDSLYTEIACQSMLDVLACLRANGFKTYIVIDHGIEFM